MLPLVLCVLQRLFPAGSAARDEGSVLLTLSQHSAAQIWRRECAKDEGMVRLVPDIVDADDGAAGLLIECRGWDESCLKVSPFLIPQEFDDSTCFIIKM